MLLMEPRRRPVSFLTVEQSRLTSPIARRQVSGSMREAFGQESGPRFIQTLRAIASGDGLGRLPGDPRLLITICSWSGRTAALDHLRSRLSASAGRDWAAAFEVASTRGSIRGAKPLAPSDSPADGTFAALTIGRARLTQLPRFAAHGTRLSGPLHDANGFRFAASAGWPPTGNCTISIWDSEEEMAEFAYGSPGGHVETAHAKRPILVEQLNARLRLIESRGLPT